MTTPLANAIPTTPAAARRSSRAGCFVASVALATIAISGCGSSNSTASQSPSYQAGYTSGTSGSAHNFLVETGTGTNGPAVAADSACGVAFTAAQILTPSLTEADYQHGCHDALSDHPVK
jgi:hypothetical protein